MKTNDTESRLTDYLLGEISAEGSLKIRDELAGNPSLKKDLEEIEQVQTTLFEVLRGENAVLSEMQRERIRRAAKEATRDGKIIELASHRRQNGWGWRQGLAAAAAVALGAYLLTFVPDVESSGGGNQVASAQIPIEQSVVEEDGSYPLDLEGDSLKEIERSVRLEQKLPDPGVVDASQVLQEFPLRAKKVVSVASGCTLGAEVFPCPWDEGSELVLVTIQGARGEEKSISVEFQGALGATLVEEVRREGDRLRSPFSPVATPIQSSDLVTFVAEVRTGDVAAEEEERQIGKLAWTVNGKAASSLKLRAKEGDEVSKDARFAALVVAFGKWLRNGEGGIDEASIESLMQEVAMDHPVSQRYEFLELIEQALVIGEN